MTSSIDGAALAVALALATGTSRAAEPMRVDFAQAQQAIGPGAMDGQTGLDTSVSMIALHDGSLVLRARSEPWGAKTGTFLYKDSGGLGPQWTLDTCLVFSSPLLEQHAGLYVGTPEASVRLLVGRPGQPYDLRLLGPAGEKLTASPAGYREGRPLWLRLLRAGTRIWGLYSLDGQQYWAMGCVDAQALATAARAGLCFLDDNPYKNEERIPVGSVPNGEARFTSFAYAPTADESLLASVPRVFVRLTLHGVTPAAPTKLAVTFYGAIHERLHKLFLGANGQAAPLPVGWHDGIPWGQFPEGQALAVGQSTGWSDWSGFFATPRTQATLAVALWQDGLPVVAGAKADDGNVTAYDVELAFASAPEDGAIVKRVRYASEFTTLALCLPANRGPLQDWGPGIRTVYDYAKDRLSVYQARGLKPVPPQEVLPISVDTMTGYHARCYDPTTEQVETQIRALLGRNTPMAMVPFADVSPWDLQLAEKLTVHLRTSLPEPPPGRFALQLGDEPGIVALEALLTSEPGLAAFRQWLPTRVRTPQDVGQTTWEQVLPLARDQVRNREQGRLCYHTVWFRQESTARRFAAYRAAAHDLWGDRVEVMTDAYYGGFDSTPDYFVESDLYATDRQGHHFGGEFSYTWDLCDADMFASASRAGHTRPGFLYFVCRINEPEGVLLTGAAALAQGLAAIRYYGYGPLYAGWEWFSDDRFRVENFAAAATISQAAARYATVLTHGVAPQPRVATLLSRSANVWSGSKESAMIELFGHPEAKEERAKLLAASRGEGGAEGWACERDMTHCALHWRGTPVGVLPEEQIERGALEQGWRVLYVHDPNVSTAAQQAIADWVRRGGVLYLGPQAATRDESNGPRDLLATLTGVPEPVRVADYEPKGTFAQRGLFGETWRMAANYNQRNVDQLRVLDTVTARLGEQAVTFPALGWKETLNLPASQVIGRYGDGSAAVASVTVGQGFVVKSGTCLGAAYARTAKPSLGLVEWYSPPPAPGATPHKQTWQRLFDEHLQDLLLTPLALAQVEPAVALSVRGVNAGTFEEPGKQALLVLGKYTTADTHPLTVRVTWQRPYRQATAFSSGEAVPLELTGSTATVTVNLQTIDFIEFRP